MDVNREPNQPYTLTCWLLTALFLARVLGQAIQQTRPQSFLPPADAFQGSTIPYGLLLAVQIVILAVMVVTTIRLQQSRLGAQRRPGIALAILGGMYAGFAIGRIAVGLTLAGAPAWFRAWIPAAFHVVLASFVLTLAVFHILRSRRVTVSQ